MGTFKQSFENEKLYELLRYNFHAIEILSMHFTWTHKFTPRSLEIRNIYMGVQMYF